MSSQVFPSLAGLNFNGKRTPLWSTAIQAALTFKESRIAYAQYPRIVFDINFEFLRNFGTTSEFKQLVGLFNQMQGQFDTFLYTDPDFNTVTTEPFGTGDGVTTAFQLKAAFQNTGGPGYSEIIQNLNGAPSIYKSAVLQTGGGVNYTLGATGIVTFTAAPAAAAPLTWTGSFYYRCRFDADELDLTEFMNLFWQSGNIRFVSVKL